MRTFLGFLFVFVVMVVTVNYLGMFFFGFCLAVAAYNWWANSVNREEARVDELRKLRLIEESRSGHRASLAAATGFHVGDVYVSDIAETGIAIDFDNREIAFTSASGRVAARYPFNSILGVEGVTIKETRSLEQVDRKSQLKGAAIGGLYGQSGVIVGGLSGDKHVTSKETLQVNGIKVRVSDIAKPLFKIPFAAEDEEAFDTWMARLQTFVPMRQGAA